MLGFDTHETKLLLKSDFPLRKKKSDFPTNNAMMFTIKNDCIPGFPN
jgi:hypothetical protein